MSDIAPFVAAAIRDNVVAQQQREIVQLRSSLSKLQADKAALETQKATLERRLAETNDNDDDDDMRTVQLVSQNRVYAECQLDANEMQESIDRVELFLQQPDAVMSLDQFLEAELLIDGNVAARMSDLTITCHEYFHCRCAGSKYIDVAFHGGEDVVMRVFIGVVPADQFRALTGVQVDFGAPIREGVYDEERRPLDISKLRAMAENKIVKVVFDIGASSISPEFFFHHLNDDFVP